MRGATMMKRFTDALAKSGFLKSDFDYYFIRASMVIVFLFFGYQKWFAYEAQVLIPYISNGPLISWLYPAFGIRGASWFLGTMEWLICLLLFLGFWSRRAGILGAIGSCGTFVATVTIIPFMPDGWVCRLAGREWRWNESHRRLLAGCDRPGLVFGSPRLRGERNRGGWGRR
jgi:uncharacterized membrane protein YkgB